MVNLSAAETQVNTERGKEFIWTFKQRKKNSRVELMVYVGWHAFTFTGFKSQ